MLVRILYHKAYQVLTEPRIVQNGHILHSRRAPLGYLPVYQPLLVDVHTGAVQPAEGWMIIPLRYRYYQDFSPVLAEKVGNLKNPQFHHQMHRLCEWATQHLPAYASHFQQALRFVQGDPEQHIDAQVRKAGWSAEEMKRLMRSFVLLVADGRPLSDLPEVIERERERFMREAYHPRIEDKGFRADYRDGKPVITLSDGRPLRTYSLLTGALVSDPCYFMVPNFAGGNMEQLVSFYGDPTNSYGRSSNLNAPMGLEESWWVAACASVLFNERRFTRKVGSASGDVCLTYLEADPQSIVEESEELQALQEILGIDLSPVEQQSQQELESARSAAVDEADRFYRAAPSPKEASSSAMLYVILREVKRGRSPVRYLSVLDAPTARERFRRLKRALQVDGYRPALWGIIQLFASGGKSSGKVPADVITALWQCSYENRPYPDHIISQALHQLAVWLAFGSHLRRSGKRKRYDLMQVFDHNRVLPALSLVKANLEFTQGGAPVSLNPDYQSTWYHLGRVVAICQEAQHRSLEGKRTNIQETLAIFQDRPHDAMNMVLLRAEPHWSKLAEEGGWLRTQLYEAMRGVDVQTVSAADKLDSKQFSELLLGYYQQLAELHPSSRKRKEESSDE